MSSVFFCFVFLYLETGLIVTSTVSRGFDDYVEQVLQQNTLPSLTESMFCPYLDISFNRCDGVFEDCVTQVPMLRDIGTSWLLLLNYLEKKVTLILFLIWLISTLICEATNLTPKKAD